MTVWLSKSVNHSSFISLSLSLSKVFYSSIKYESQTKFSSNIMVYCEHDTQKIYQSGMHIFVLLFFSKNFPNHCLSHLIPHEGLAAVSFSSGVPWFGGVGLGLGLMGKPRCEWVGAWVFGGGDVEMMWWGWEYAWG